MATKHADSGPAAEEADIFDEILLAEERFYNTGVAEGEAQGREQGLEEGMRLGKTHGSRIGSELGFYMGFVQTWIKLLEKEGKMKPRKEKATAALVRLIEAFPMDDPQNPELLEKVQEVRAKFKQVCSLLNVNPEYSATDQQQGISF